MRKAWITILLVLLADQVLKVWVKTNMYLDESIPVFGDWFYIHFIENPGMAFGFEFGGSMGKLALTLFRICAVIAISVYLRKEIKQGAKSGFIICGSLVLAGAIGNILDSIFYGVIFSESPRFSPETAVFMPADGGYAPFLHGHVVDMFYFPIFDGILPQWIPFWGGEYFQFFRPVFNIADAAITVGIILIMINQKKFFSHQNKKAVENPETTEQQTDMVGDSV